MPGRITMRLARTSAVIDSQKQLLIPLLLAVGFFICGLILGAVSLRNLDPLVQQEMRQFLTYFLEESSVLSTYSFSDLKTWYQILKMQVASVALLWFFGLTVVGTPLILLLIAAKGFTVGITVGFLVQEEAGKGLLLALLGVLPQNLCYIPALLGAGVLSLYFSFTLLRTVRDAPLRSIGVYSLIFLFFVLLVLLGSWVETYLVPNFLKLLSSLYQ
ncbi:MAG TPA: stage II sporulation protein M [Syntrophomonadaceae bacterium]|nr:stage II sporulation protein M [Syntrophomonadaceae bacterium]